MWRRDVRLYRGVSRRNHGSQVYPTGAQGHHTQVAAKRPEVETDFEEGLCHLQLHIN